MVGETIPRPTVSNLSASNDTARAPRLDLTTFVTTSYRESDINTANRGRKTFRRIDFPDVNGKESVTHFKTIYYRIRTK